MSRKYAWWNYKKVPPKTTKQTRKIADRAKETRIIQEHIDNLFKIYIKDNQLDTSITAYTEIVGATIGRRDHSYRVKVNISGGIPMTIREMAEVDLTSIGFRKYGPLHKRGRITYYAGVECSPDNVDSRVKSAWDILMKYINEGHMLIKTQPGGVLFGILDYYKKEDEF